MAAAHILILDDHEVVRRGPLRSPGLAYLWRGSGWNSGCGKSESPAAKIAFKLPLSRNDASEPDVARQENTVQSA